MVTVTDGEIARGRDVSVVVTAYNRSCAVVEAVTSALAQTHRPVEVIVVDDGSSDGTHDVVRRAFADPRVHVVRKPNGGPASARNCGLDAASARFTPFLDSDDLWLPRYLETQLSFLGHGEEPAFVVCDGLCEEPGDRWRTLSSYPRWQAPVDARAAEAGTWILPSFTVVLTKVARAVRFDETLNFCDDTDFLIRLLLRRHTGVVNPGRWALYRLSSPVRGTDAERLSADEDRLLLATYDVWRRYEDRLPRILRRDPHWHLEYARRLARHRRHAEAARHFARYLAHRPYDLTAAVAFGRAAIAATSVAASLRNT